MVTGATELILALEVVDVVLLVGTLAVVVVEPCPVGASVGSVAPVVAVVDGVSDLLVVVDVIEVVVVLGVETIGTVTLGTGVGVGNRAAPSAEPVVSAATIVDIIVLKDCSRRRISVCGVTFSSTTSRRGGNAELRKRHTTAAPSTAKSVGVAKVSVLTRLWRCGCVGSVDDGPPRLPPPPR